MAAHKNSVAVARPAHQPERLAFTIGESARMIGVSRVSMYRLLERGLIKASGALRHKLIARSELERFLRETTV